MPELALEGIGIDIVPGWQPMRCPFPLPILPKFRDFSIRELVQCQKNFPNKLEAESGVFSDALGQESHLRFGSQK